MRGHRGGKPLSSGLCCSKGVACLDNAALCACGAGERAGLVVALPGFPLGRSLRKPKFPLGLHILVVGKLPFDAVKPCPLRWGNTAGRLGRGLALRHFHWHGKHLFFSDGDGKLRCFCRHGWLRSKKRDGTFSRFCRHMKLSRKSMMVSSIPSLSTGSGCTG